ncbi:MAG: T9SS type A sorting domain-containing protein, partial [Bacteroidota bacterium]|nr:T9SS type A sorting domain-containing protein [Bacteroidota bacterium]
IPVGKGTSSKQFCNSASLFSFSDEGLDIDFPASGTWPNGEIVVTHLNYLPAAMPNNYPNLGSYWIVNNYGDNQQITSLNELVFYPGAGELSALVIADPSKAVLYKRNDNSGTNNWSQLCAASNATNGANSYLTFSNSCNITNMGQFYICSNDSLVNLVGSTVTVVEKKPAAEKNRISLFPNPVSNNATVFVDYSGNEQLRIKLFNAEGKLCNDIFIEKHQAKQFSAAGISAGIYFYLIEGESFIDSGKIAVE